MSALGQSGHGPEASLAHFLRFLNRYRMAVVLSAVVGASLFVGINLWRGERYTANASIAASQPSPVTALPAAALQLGVQLTPSQGQRASGYYAALFESDEILGRMVLMEYERDVGEPASLAVILEARGDSDRAVHEDAVRRLRDAIIAWNDFDAGVTRLTVTARYPEVASAVARDLIEAVDALDRKVVQEQARAEREMVDRLLEDAQSELTAAENALDAFMRSNRAYSSDPTLSLDHERLVRTVGLRERAVLTLIEGQQQLRIEEARNTPVLTLIENPDVPHQPDPRNFAAFAILGAILGTAAALGIAGLGESLRAGWPDE